MVIRHIFVWLLAATFVVAGSVARTSPVATAQEHHGSVAAAPDVQQGHAAHQGHDSHHHDHAGTAIDGHDHVQPKDVEHDDDCLKCCTMCGVASMTAEYLGTPVTFAYGAVRFRIGQQHLLGHLVALDPDIPKSIV